MEGKWNIEKHLLQKGELDKSISKIIKEKYDEKIVIYGLTDLSENLRIELRWIIITEKNLFYFSENNSKLIKRVPLSKISKVSSKKTMSYETLKMIEADDKEALLEVFYTGKQRVMMSKMKWFLEEVAKKNDVSFEKEVCPHEIYKESTLHALKEVQAENASEKSSTLKRLIKLLEAYKSYVILGSLGATFATGLALIPPYLTGKLMDELIKPYGKGLLTSEDALKKAWPLVIVLGLSYVLREFFIYLRLNRMSHMGEYVARDLREKLFSHLQELDMDFFSKNSSGSLISRVSSDTDRIWDFIAFGVTEVTIAILTLTGLSSMLIMLDWKLGLVMTLPVPLFLWAIFMHGERMQMLFTKCFRKWSKLTSILSDTIPGMQVVKAFSKHEHEVAKFNRANEGALDQFYEVHEAWTKFWPILMLGIHATMMMTWCLAVPRLFSVDGGLSAGTFVSFLLYMTMFSAPIEIIGQMARMMNRAVSSAHRVFEILDSRAKIISPKNGEVLKDIKGDIEFKDVRFSYDGLRPILKGVSFKIKEGEMIGLVGSSGGGKSTITKLITRFYDVGSGEVLIDGKNIKNLELSAYRKSVGMVLQEPYLFHGTILENIAYGIENVGLMDVVDAAKVANAHDFIMGLPHGYETVIGERGHNLSGGERQRVSIARAILHNPKILILDEATSAVDTETERKIQDALDKLVKGRTVIAVAHRLSTLRKADRIFVIKSGKIVESGPHAELLSDEDGEYYKLHRMQKDMNESFAL